jgi:hypothetical protein
MKDKEYESYNREHNYTHPSDVEQGKIKKETKTNAKYRMKSKNMTQNLLRHVKKLSDFDESIYEEVERVNYKAKKEKNNAKSHKKRLKKLKKHKDFN